MEQKIIFQLQKQSLVHILNNHLLLVQLLQFITH